MILLCCSAALCENNTLVAFLDKADIRSLYTVLLKEDDVLIVQLGFG